MATQALKVIKSRNDPNLKRPFEVTLSNSAQVIPREDLKPGDLCHSRQIFHPSPEEVYEKSKLGLTPTGTAALFDFDKTTFLFHYGKTFARARAQAAVDLMERMSTKAFDEFTKGDKDAIKFVLNRLDKEEEPLPVAIINNYAMPDRFAEVNTDDLLSIVNQSSGSDD